MSRTFEQAGIMNSLYGLEIGTVNAEQFVGQCALQFGDARMERVLSIFEQQLAGEGITVGMESLRREAEEHVTRFDVSSRDHAFAFDSADDKARQVIFARFVEAGHFGGFATDERAAVVFAAAGDSRDDACANRCIELSHCEIVQEK